MRFSANGYYIERYVKCDCCGVLIYGDGIAHGGADRAERLYCTQWCREWHAQKIAGIDAPTVDLPFDR
jgi:N-methylhydantoinase B